ncbi:hypothetical protein SANTM175S_08782 [Streptomyces antimycoticus]
MKTVSGRLVVEPDRDEAEDDRAEDRGRRHAAGVGAGEGGRGVAALAEREGHAGGRVEPGVQTREHGGQHDHVHDVAGVRNADRVQRRDVAALVGDGLGVPGQQRDHDEDRAQVEDRDTPDHAVGGLGDRPPRVLGLTGREGDDLAAHEGEDHQQDAGEDGARPVRQEAAVIGEVGQARALVVRMRQHPEHREPADHDERADRHDLDPGEPELELTVGADRDQVGRGEHHHDDQRPAPLRDRRPPALQDLGAGGGLDRRLSAAVRRRR